MGLTRRILEGARTGLSQLSSLVIVDDEELSQVDEADLEAELKARRAAREAHRRKPEDNPVARIAGASPDARRQRARQAHDREGKIRGERAARAAQQKAAADEAFRRMKEQAGRAPTGAGPRSATGTAGARPPRAGSRDAQVVEWYRVLDLSPGADLAAIKSAYRKLMRKYHPDLFTGDHKKQKAATELSMRVTNAYNGLRQHLGEK
jgi:DnaJ-domain-containing protein 1